MFLHCVYDVTHSQKGFVSFPLKHLTLDSPDRLAVCFFFPWPALTTLCPQMTDTWLLWYFIIYIAPKEYSYSGSSQIETQLWCSWGVWSNSCFEDQDQSLRRHWKLGASGANQALIRHTKSCLNHAKIEQLHSIPCNAHQKPSNSNTEGIISTEWRILQAKRGKATFRPHFWDACNGVSGELWPSHVSFLPVVIYPWSSASTLNINSNKWDTRPFHNGFAATPRLVSSYG